MNEFAKARRGRVVHRIRSARSYNDGRTGMTWVCGGLSVDAIPVSSPVDTCRWCDEPVPDTMVYRCYSADGQLLYIGSCLYWYDRWCLHKTRTPWWPQVARVDKTPYPDLKTAQRCEKSAIRAEAPLHNKQYNVQRFRLVRNVWVPTAEAA